MIAECVCPVATAALASVRRYVDIELTRVPGIPGHVMMDPSERVLYISDTGGNRVLRINPDSGHFLRTAKREFPIYSSVAETFQYTIWGCTEWEVFVDGVDRPSGLHIEGNTVFVAEWGTSTIIAFDKRTGEGISSVATGATGLMGITAGPAATGGRHDGQLQLWFTDGPANTVSYIRVDRPCPLADNRPSPSSAVDWPERTCNEVVNNSVFVDHGVHAAGYMNLSAFLDIGSYADAQQHHCGGGDITQGAAMAGMPTSGRINNDALLMEGYMCHICLPSPCMNGGVCQHPQAWQFTCDCTGTGYVGDICQNEGKCTEIFGEINSVHVFATAADKLSRPSDVQFHPQNPTELWIANKDTDDVTLLDVSTGAAVNRKDRA